MSDVKHRLRRRAVYNVTFYDWDWAEITEARLLHVTASEMIMAVEAFNQGHQRTVREKPFDITLTPHPLSCGIEVYYVEEK